RFSRDWSSDVCSSDLPSTAKVGEVIEIKTLISHVMETGQRKDQAGNTIPRNIINTFIATFNGKEVFKVDLQPGISANPYMAFHKIGRASCRERVETAE